MKIALGIRSDEMTHTGRIYPKEVLDKALAEAVDRGIAVVDKYPESWSAVPIDSIVGFIEGVETNEDGYVVAEVSVVKNKLPEEGEYALLPNGTGILDKLKIVSDYKLISFTVVPKKEIEEESTQI